MGLFTGRGGGDVSKVAARYIELDNSTCEIYVGIEKMLSADNPDIEPDFTVTREILDRLPGFNNPRYHQDDLNALTLIEKQGRNPEVASREVSALETLAKTDPDIRVAPVIGLRDGKIYMPDLGSNTLHSIVYNKGGSIESLIQIFADAIFQRADIFAAFEQGLSDDDKAFWQTYQVDKIVASCEKNGLAATRDEIEACPHAYKFAAAFGVEDSSFITALDQVFGKTMRDLLPGLGVWTSDNYLKNKVVGDNQETWSFDFDNMGFKLVNEDDDLFLGGMFNAHRHFEGAEKKMFFQAFQQLATLNYQLLGIDPGSEEYRQGRAVTAIYRQAFETIYTAKEAVKIAKNATIPVDYYEHTNNQREGRVNYMNMNHKAETDIKESESAYRQFRAAIDELVELDPSLEEDLKLIDDTVLRSVLRNYLEYTGVQKVSQQLFQTNLVRREEGVEPETILLTITEADVAEYREHYLAGKPYVPDLQTETRVQDRNPSSAAGVDPEPGVSADSA
ncbi:hypothetical protein ACFL0V_02940 [Nanoarchaeota archaeon]